MSVENFCDVLALLRKAPRTIPELVAITSMTDNTVRFYLKALQAEGHVGHGEPRANSRGKPTQVWCWLDTLFGKPQGDSQK